MNINVSDSRDMKLLVSSYLVDKGVDINSADYLANLYVDSAQGKKVVNDGNFAILGSCNVIGLFPG